MAVERGTPTPVAAQAPPYTLDRAAQRLHISRRTLQDWLRAHPADPAGQPFYSVIGRTKTFDDGDIARIRAAAREEERCRLNSSAAPRQNALLRGPRLLPRPIH
jgi:hypothetical protein